MARPYEAQGSGVCPGDLFHTFALAIRWISARGGKLNQKGNTSHDSTGSCIDDGPLPSDHRRRFMLYWAALASDALRTRKWAMSMHFGRFVKKRSELSNFQSS